MYLFEYNQAIESILDEVVDEATGEAFLSPDILEKLNELEMGKAEKVENICCYIKDLSAKVTAFKAEEDRLAKRRKMDEKRVESLKEYLRKYVQNEKFESAKFALSWRSSESTDIPDETIIPKKFCKKIITYKPDKAAIKAALKSGLKVKGAALVSKSNPQIK